MDRAILWLVVLWLALTTGMLCFVGKASADWQGTVWGMSEEEANKAFRVPHNYDPHAGSLANAPIPFEYRTGNIFFPTAFLQFDYHGRLVEIQMTLSTPEECGELINTYRSIYGEPVSDRKKPTSAFRREVTWHDSSHNNKIRVVSAHVCSVYYDPLEPLKPPIKPPPIKLTPTPGGL
jgi:hypothetical protein